MIFIIIYIYSYLYLCIYTPSYPHFKAFPVLKFNSETSFLCQLFKENSNIIVLKPGKLINEAIFWFSLLFIFIHIFIDAYTVLLISPGTFGKTAILIFCCSTHSCHWMSKQISQGFRECLKVKKIKKQFLEIRPGRPPTCNNTVESETFCFNGRNERDLVIGQVNKLAEVLEHVLGMKKY